MKKKESNMIAGSWVWSRPPMSAASSNFSLPLSLSLESLVKHCLSPANATLESIYTDLRHESNVFTDKVTIVVVLINSIPAVITKVCESELQ